MRNRFYDKHAPTIVIALNDQNEEEQVLKDQIYQHFIPHKVVIWRYAKDKDLCRVIPYLKDLIPLNDKTTLYICYEGACQTPLNDISAMKEAIQQL